MMQSLEWEDSQSCFMTVVLLMQMTELLSEDTQFPNFVLSLKKLQEANSLYLKLCFTFYSQESIQQTLNFINCNKNGKQEEICAKKLKVLFSVSLDSSILWLCSRWRYYSCSKTANFLKLINQESISPNIGNTTMKIQWIY